MLGNRKLGVDHGSARSSPEETRKPPRLCCSNDHVVRALQNHEWRGIGADLVGRRGAFPAIAVRPHRCLEDLLFQKLTRSRSPECIVVY